MAKTNIKLRLDALYAWIKDRKIVPKKEVAHNDFEGPIKMGKQR